MAEISTRSRQSPLAWLSGLRVDVRHAARVFAKHPGLTAIAIVSIAFGTGANVASFSLAATAAGRVVGE